MLFADEPTGNLDEENSGQIAALLADLTGRGQTVVISTHNLDLARRFCGRVIRLNYGKISAESPGEEGDG